MKEAKETEAQPYLWHAQLKTELTEIWSFPLLPPHPNWFALEGRERGGYYLESKKGRSEHKRNYKKIILNCKYQIL